MFLRRAIFCLREIKPTLAALENMKTKRREKRGEGREEGNEEGILGILLEGGCV